MAKTDYLLNEATIAEFIKSDKYAPLASQSDANMMKILLKNQGLENASLCESTVSADIAQFTPILVPVLRRAYPSLIGTEIAGVQALQAPTGYVYAMVARYVGDGKNQVNPNNNAFVITVKPEAGNETKFDVINQVTKEVGFKVATANNGKAIYSEKMKNGDVALLVVPTASGDVKVAVGEEIDQAAAFAAKKATVTGVYTNEALWLKVLKNYSGAYDTAKGEQLGLDMAELGFDVSRVVATAKTRKLKGVYTIEMLQDLKSQHGIDAEKELSAMLSAEVALEIDRSIIAKANEVSTVTSDFAMNSADGRWAMEKARLLGLRLTNEAREIGRQTRKGGGNKLIVSPKVASVLDQVGSYILASSGKQIDVSNSGVQPKVGKFDNRYDVIVDNFADYEYVTVAYKGSNYDAGIIFAPYNITHQSVIDPVTGKPGIILSNRYDIVPTALHPEAFIRSFGVNFTGFNI